MDLTGQTVIHKSFGEGTVIEHADTYLTIAFDQGNKTFQYPDAFRQFLTAADSAVDDVIKKELSAIDHEKALRLKHLEEREARARQQRLTEAAPPSEMISGKAVKRKKAKVIEQFNIAFKCNYCDGGQSQEQVGFDGVCSDQVITNNIIVERRTWCSDEECACRQYLDGDITRKDLKKMMNKGGFVCYESQMLRDWRAFAGNVLTGENKGRPFKLDHVKPYSLCVLTTRDPGAGHEGERYIFAVFLVDETFNGDNREAGYVTTASKYRMKLSQQEAYSMPFWKYHANSSQPDKPMWASGLFRYLDDETAALILRDIAAIKKDSADEALAEDFYQHFCRIKGIETTRLGEPKGALMV